MQSACELNGAISRLRLQIKTRMHGILEVQGQADQLRNVEQIAREQRMKNVGQIAGIPRQQTQRVFAIERLELFERLAGNLEIALNAKTHFHQSVDIR